MVNFLMLLLVAIIVNQDVEVLKGLKDYIWNKQWKEGKFGIPLSLMVGAIAGMTLGIGITEAIIQMVGLVTGLEFTFSDSYQMFDIVSSCLLISKGAGFLIDTLDKYKNAKGQVNTNPIIINPAVDINSEETDRLAKEIRKRLEETQITRTL